MEHGNDILHPFERAGLGKAPFRFTGMRERTLAHAHRDMGMDGPLPPEFFSRPGSSCDYCHTGIRYEYWILSADGREFKVGCDCVQKTGDARLSGEIKDERKRQAAERRQERRDERRRERRAERERFRRAVLREWARENRALLPLLKIDHDAARDMRARLIRWPQYGLTAKQVEFLERLQKGTVEVPVAIPEDLLDGRVEIEGQVLSTRTEAFGYGWTTKMLVKVRHGEGFFKLWGTAPVALLGDEPLKGAHVRFTARVRRSDRDEHFGFITRPTKAVRLDTATEAA